MPASDEGLMPVAMWQQTVPAVQVRLPPGNVPTPAIAGRLYEPMLYYTDDHDVARPLRREMPVAGLTSQTPTVSGWFCEIVSPSTITIGAPNRPLGWIQAPISGGTRRA